MINAFLNCTSQFSFRRNVCAPQTSPSLFFFNNSTWYPAENTTSGFHYYTKFYHWKLKEYIWPYCYRLMHNNEWVKACLRASVVTDFPLMSVTWAMTAKCKTSLGYARQTIYKHLQIYISFLLCCDKRCKFHTIKDITNHSFRPYASHSPQVKALSHGFVCDFFPHHSHYPSLTLLYTSLNT